MHEVQLLIVPWQVMQEVLQVVHMWVVVSGYVPGGQEVDATQEVPVKNDSSTPEIVQAEQLVEIIAHIVHFE